MSDLKQTPLITAIADIRAIADFLARSVQRINLGPENGQDYATAFDYELDQAAGALYHIALMETPASSPGNAGITFTLDDVKRIIRLKVAPKRPMPPDAFRKMVDDFWDAASTASNVPGVQRRHFARLLLATGETAPKESE